MFTVKKYYFAYGSNMSQGRLEARVGKVKRLGTVRLHGYILVFNAGIETNCCANIYKTGNTEHFVEGVVYELTRRQLRILDRYEGSPWLYNRVIEKLDRMELNVYICFSDRFCQQERRQIKPSAEYIGYCITGCLENNLLHTLNILRNI